jgi:hypothetical protein
VGQLAAAIDSCSIKHCSMFCGKSASKLAHSEGFALFGDRNGYCSKNSRGLFYRRLGLILCRNAIRRSAPLHLSVYVLPKLDVFKAALV